MLALDIVILDGEGVARSVEFGLAQQQGGRVALFAPPPEDLLAVRQLTRGDGGEDAQNIQIGKVLVVLSGSRRAVEHHRDQTLAESLLQPLHELGEQLLDVHGAIYQSLEAPPPPKSPPPKPPKLSPESGPSKPPLLRPPQVLRLISCPSNSAG